MVRWLGPLVPFAIGLGFFWLAKREVGRRRFPSLSRLDLLAGPFALAVYGLAFVATACALWVTG